MSGGLLILLGLCVATLVWAVAVYNRFVALRNAWRNAFAQIDVQLKRRYDLIPNLVAATKGYLAHERATLEAVTAARQRAVDAEDAARGLPADAGRLAALDAAEQALAAPLGRLFALVEAYPELKADERVAELVEELATAENRIAFARQAFNDQVMSYNNGIEAFPASVVATLTGFGRAASLRATRSAAEREPVPVAL